MEVTQLSPGNISDTMKNFGILNQGRFAQDYFKFYNVYPHQTRNVIINQSVDGNI
jgi:hypothetical protein